MKNSAANKIVEVLWKFDYFNPKEPEIKKLPKNVMNIKTGEIPNNVIIYKIWDKDDLVSTFFFKFENVKTFVESPYCISEHPKYTAHTFFLVRLDKINDKKTYEKLAKTSRFMSDHVFEKLRPILQNEIRKEKIQNL